MPERGEAFVVNSVAGTVARINLDDARVVEELRVGEAPVGLTVAPAHDRVYVSNRGAGTVSVLEVELPSHQIALHGGGGVRPDQHDRQPGRMVRGAEHVRRVFHRHGRAQSGRPGQLGDVGHAAGRADKVHPPDPGVGGLGADLLDGLLTVAPRRYQDQHRADQPAPVPGDQATPRSPGTGSGMAGERALRPRLVGRQLPR